MKRPLTKERALDRIERLSLGEPKKSAIVKIAVQYEAAGLIDAPTVREVRRLQSDRDMTYIDLLSEIRDSLLL